MDRMIYLSMSGAKAAMQRQEVLANNLANVSTNGFRAELAAFRAVPVQGDGASTRVYALESTVGASFEPGAVTPTGRPLDVDAQGQLVTKTGLPVLGEGGPITIPAGSEASIAGDGTVSAKAANGRITNVGRLKLVTPESPAQMTRGTDGLFRAVDGELGRDANARLQDGALEGSNVSAVETMVAMISAARQFEHQMKLMQTVERQEQQAAKLLSANGM